MMKKVLTWLNEVLQDRNGTASHKRLIAFAISVTFIVTILFHLISKHPVQVEIIFAQVAVISAGIGFSVAEKKNTKTTTTDG